LRASARLKYPGKTLERLGLGRLRVLTLDRASAAGEDRGKDRIERAIVEAGTPPDILVDAKTGDKEIPMHILGEDPQRVLGKVRRLAGGRSS
jgi:predicted fused transcriptional regulator/phosphomethylpyrimidine kinase